ncbi:MAG: sugar nucleotide-binding protein [Oscillospiraceae bacterium]|nr:sugar nucleotide-binding protein [Oscillospiraceae bacterium]
MTVIVTGSDQGLGRCFVNELIHRGHEVITDTGVDLTDPVAVNKFIRGNHPDTVIHCRSIKGREIKTAENIAVACAECIIPVMLISSGDVFGAVGSVPENVKRIPKTQSAKILYCCENIVAEKCPMCYIFRLPPIVFGQGGEGDIVLRLMNAGKERKSFEFESTLEYSCVYAADAAELGVDIIESRRFGAYHCANGGSCTMFGFACEVFRCTRLAGHEDYYDITVTPYERKGMGLVLLSDNLEKAKIAPLGDWREALDYYIRTEKNNIKQNT